MKLLFLILAIVCFLLLALSVVVVHANWLAIGLLFFACSFLPIKE